MIKTRKALILTIAIIACVLTFYVFLLIVPSFKAASADTVTVGGKTVTAVEWQCKKADGDSFVWQTYETALQLEYKAADLSDSVRAVLTFDDASTANVYAEGVEADDAASAVHLEFVGTFDGEAVTTPYNATTYTVTLSDGTQALDGYSTTLDVAPAVLDLTAADLEWSDNKTERPWLVDIDGVTTTLLDSGISFYDPDSDDNLGSGTDDDSYVAFRGINTTLSLNADYVVGERTLQAYLDDAEITYTDNEAVGVNSEITTVHTVALLTFNGNYVSQEGSSTAAVLRLEKTWYVVTLSNALRGGDGSETPTFADLHFGDEEELVPMRGEHGDTAVFMVKQNGATANDDGFAAVFGDDGIQYYGAKRVSGGYEADLTAPLDSDHYSKFFYALGAGDYDLTVYLPEHRNETDHTHWWDDTESDVTETNIVYHASQYTFNFSVSAYKLDNGEGGFNAGIVLEFDDDIAVTYYNGEANNIPALTITLNGRTLANGVDYALSSTQIDVGDADLTISGLGGLDGTVELKSAYHILKAVNRWIETPNVINWLYGSFDPIVNTITATG